MVRRKPYTKVDKTNQIRADHVRGMGRYSLQRLPVFEQ